jgi:hypothetical protein
VKAEKWQMVGALVVACSHAAAAPVGDSARACDDVRADQQSGRLSQILRELRARRSYTLKYWTTEDPLVTHRGGTEFEIMTALSHQANLLVRYARLPHCPGKWKIRTVWVLPSGPAPVARSATPSVVTELDAPVGTPARFTPLSPAAAMQEYLTAHGLAPAPAQPSSAASASVR